VRVFAWRRLGIRPVTLEADAVDGFRTKQMVIFAAVRLVTGAAAVPERRLVKDLLGSLKLRLSGMTPGAGTYSIRTQETGFVPRMWVMAVDAITLRSRMLHLRVLDLFCDFLMARKAQLF